MTEMVRIYLGLGGNIANELGDPTSHILAVRDALLTDERFCDVRLSSLYSSKAYGVTDQPDFVNAVLSAKTTLAPLELLDVCQALENSAGRVRLRRWGERSLDVDVLLYGDEIIHNERLIVPHKEILLRNFVVIPLLELDPSLVIGDIKIAELTIASCHDGLIKQEK
ncbi:2-amino-4-hydroxy-6-hydroxymethyldihydropteridine diphosphokinase [Moraxella haemolytica]|nr:2-amino-4-hydroxy-6-hydroxymethyldihydropteridine diphosphokinase [Moraxella sp. ZY171148]WII95200.1 2-amino-4-hydroxy-6-hydroxymethyldihydropteridine diphosphokinase [Moraxella sp. ZY171148]